MAEDTPTIRLEDRGAEVTKLHYALRKVGFEIPQAELAEGVYGLGTERAVVSFQAHEGIDPSGAVEEETLTRLEQKATGEPSAARLVQGTILLQSGGPAVYFPLRLYGRTFGEEADLLSEGETDDQGLFTLTYEPGEGRPALEIRALDRNENEVVLSDPIQDPGPSEVIHLVAPDELDRGLAEFDRLTGDLLALVGDLQKLGQAREGDERKDLSFLAARSGWDARLIAFASRAVALSDRGETGIPAPALYGAFRLGLPTSADELARITVRDFGTAIDAATKARVVNLSSKRITAARAAFESFATRQRANYVTPGTSSSFGQMMSAAGLTKDEQTAFQEAHVTDSDRDDLWKRARERGIPEAKVDRLRLQGKLAFLTLNNAPLSKALEAKIGSADQMEDLVGQGLYKEDTWKERLRKLSGSGGNKALAALIPPAYDDASTPARLNAYASDLARKVRLAFPNQVVVEMLRRKELQIGNPGNLNEPVAKALENGIGVGFELGRVPVSRFVQENSSKLVSGIPKADQGKTIEALKDLSRIYQITPSNEAMTVLISSGFRSALDVTAYTEAEFVSRYGGKFTSINEAKVIYQKAETVTAVAYNFYTAAKVVQSTPDLAATSAGSEARAEALSRIGDHFPTMEQLFGSLDFCECEHCRSVLSPAAYLVDLLRFLDPDPGPWSFFTTQWDKRHTATYASRYSKPFEALIERRPDLQYLPLTCENTNTALPYIDVVNEILEYYVVNKALGKDAAHDTGSVTTPELLAEPQNILPAAYDELNKARYPLTLPFDLWLESARAFLDQFDAPLWQVLEAFRQTDELTPKNPGSAPPYYRDAIFAEYLGLSPTEVSIFSQQDAASSWQELYGLKPGDKPEKLAPAKTLSRALGVSYRELIDLVKTGFVNPGVEQLVLLHKLEVEPEELFRYKDHPKFPSFTASERAAFEQKIEQLAKAFGVTVATAKGWLEQAWKGIDAADLLVLAGPASGCDFEETKLRHADGSDVGALDLLRLNLFVRLWRKLDWSIEETDRALCILTPNDPEPKAESTLGTALRTALIYLAHLKRLEQRLRPGKDGRTKLLSFWANLATTGRKPLYAQLFLTRSILKNDPVFDEPLGNYLSANGIGMGGSLPAIEKHLAALQSALGLTADEIERILVANNRSLGSDLSLANVSLLYRHGLLAKLLKLKVRELIALCELSGVKPFKPLEKQPIEKIADDHPFQQALHLVDVAELVRESGFQVEDLDYLLRHRADPVGKYRDDPVADTQLASALAAEIERIKKEHAIPDDPAAFTDEILGQKAGMVFDPDVVETLAAIWADTVEFEAESSSVTRANALDPQSLADEPRATLNYDKAASVQTLRFRGNPQQLSVPNSAPQLLKTLVDDVKAKANEFYAAFYARYLASFLSESQFNQILAPIPRSLSGTPAQQEAEKQRRLLAKRKLLAEALLPFLQQRLIREVIADRLAAALGADRTLTDSLLTDPRLLAEPGQAPKPLLEAFAASQQGIAVDYFTSMAATGTPQKSGVEARPDTTQRPEGTKSVKFEGYLQVQVDGRYSFFAAIDDKDVEAEMRLEGEAEPVLSGVATDDNDEVAGIAELRAGVPYRFTFMAMKLASGEVRLLVETKTLPRESLDALALYPPDVLERIHRARILLAKTLQLVGGLELTETEIHHILTHAGDFDAIELRKLPTAETPAGQSQSPAPKVLFGQLLRLAAYKSLKGKVEAVPEDLVGVLESARRSLASTASATEVNHAKAELFKDVCARFAAIVRREPETVEDAAKHLGYEAKKVTAAGKVSVEIAALADERGPARIWEILEIIEKLGTTVDLVAGWTKIVAVPGVQRPPASEIARDLKNTIKARYEPDNWQRIAQPIFDKLRKRQRNALVAYIMESQGFASVNELFEYFLLDPGMEPVVQTSRIQLAIASVQLFVQRCLLNLEDRDGLKKKVPAAAISAERWSWMKRYRVWEANRKIFLFPENWLEPEFRDDKTHLFQEMESALLQGDVSDELVEDAFLRYLTELERISRLEIVSMYCEEDEVSVASNTLHVIGRTYSDPHAYFYRRYTQGMWTPWEPVEADIDGDHIVAVVWRSRLHLFWVRFMDLPDKPSGSEPSGARPVKAVAEDPVATPVPKQVQIQLNWTEQVEGVWTKPESTAFGPAISVNPYFSSADVFIGAEIEYRSDGSEGAIRILVESEAVSFRRAIRLAGRNAAPEQRVVQGLKSPLPEPPFDLVRMGGTHYQGDRELTVHYVPVATTVDRNAIAPSEPHRVLTISAPRLETGRGDEGRYGFLTISNQLLGFGPEFAQLLAPFFIEDGLNTFFVEPNLVETTIDRWEQWALTPAKPDVATVEDGLVVIPVTPQFPQKFPEIKPDWPRPHGPNGGDPIDPLSRFKLQPKEDWVAGERTLVSFDRTPIGRNGALTLDSLGVVDAAGENEARLADEQTVAASGYTLVGERGAPVNGSMPQIVRDQSGDGAGWAYRPPDRTGGWI